MPDFKVDRDTVTCERCNEEFTDFDTYETHQNSDHGDMEEDPKEVVETYINKMNPDLTIEALEKAKKLIRETNMQELYHSRPFKNPKAKIPTKLEPHNSADDLVAGVNGYNDNPNAGLYDNKIFRAGSSKERVSYFGEGYDESGNYSEKCPDCGRTFDNPADAASHNEDTGELYESRRASEFMDHGLRRQIEEQIAGGYIENLQQVINIIADKLGDDIGISQEQRDSMMDYFYVNPALFRGAKESRRIAREVGTEICTCGHFGGSTSEDKNQHDDRFQQGHGACRNCNCSQFTWTPYDGEAHGLYDPHGLDDQHSDFQWHKADSSDLLRTDQPERKADGTLSSKGYYSNDQDRVGRADYRESRRASEAGEVNSDLYWKWAEQHSWVGSAPYYDAPKNRSSWMSFASTNGISDSEATSTYNWYDLSPNSSHNVGESRRRAREFTSPCDNCGKQIDFEEHPECPYCWNKYWSDTHGTVSVQPNTKKLNESRRRAREDITFADQSIWYKMSSSQKMDMFEDVVLQGTHFNEDNEENWAKYNYGDTDWSNLPASIQDGLRQKGIMKHGAPESRRAREGGDDSVEICTCGHFGGSTDEPWTNQHADRFQKGHGACKVCNCSQFTWTPYSRESETSNYEVDVDEYLESGVAIQKIGGGRSELELNNNERITGEADNYPQKTEMTDNEWEKDLDDIKNRYQGENEDVNYDDLGTTSTQGVEQPLEDIPALERINFGYEKYQEYPTKTKVGEAVGKKEKSYYTEVYDGIVDDYDRFDENDEDDVKELVEARKMQGYSSETIAKELVMQYGVSKEDAYEKVYSIEVSVNDQIANTFFQKKYNECNDAEKDELKLYAGSDE